MQFFYNHFFFNIVLEIQSLKSLKTPFNGHKNNSPEPILISLSHEERSKKSVRDRFHVYS